MCVCIVSFTGVCYTYVAIQPSIQTPSSTSQEIFRDSVCSVSSRISFSPLSVPMWLHTGLHSVRAHGYSSASHHLAVLGRLSQLDLSLYSSYYRLVLNHQWLHKGKRAGGGEKLCFLSFYAFYLFFLPCYSNLLLSSRSSRYCVKKD